MGLYTKVAGAWQEIGVDGGGGVPWAKVTGGTVTEYTKADGSVMEVHTFTAASNLVVVEPGYAEVALCGGGGGNGTGTSGGGGGGAAWDGVLALPVGTHAVVIGAGGPAGNSDQGGTQGGHSSLGSLVKVYGGGGTATYGYPPYSPYSPRTGAPALGALGSTSGGGGGALSGSSGTTPGAGVVTMITGTAMELGKGGPVGADPTGYGQGCRNTGSVAGRPGVVIVAVQKSAPTVSGVAASGGTETQYTGDGTNGVLGQKYKVHTFSTPGAANLVVAQGGEADVFLISGGGAKDTARPGSGGRVFLGTITLAPGTVPVVVGAGAVFGGTAFGAPSSLGGIATGAAAGYSGNAQSTGAGSTVANPTAGLVSYITGSAVEYGKVGATTPGSSPVADNSSGIAGAVIVRYKVA